MESRTGRVQQRELHRLQECLGALFASADERVAEVDPARLETYGEGVERISRIPVRDNGEPLVNVAELDLGIRLAESHPWSSFPRVYWVRRAIAEMLADAQSRLPDGIQIELLEGYRPLRIQRRLFAAAYRHLRSRHPRWTPAQLREAANVLVADPSIAPPPHATGGAVDVMLVDTGGRRLDLTSPLPCSELSAPTHCPGLSAEARAHRALLVQALSGAGLTNYPGEWWHWSFGEPGWAIRTGAPHAIYGPVEPPISLRRRPTA